jgi:hypothetical protein
MFFLICFSIGVVSHPPRAEGGRNHPRSGLRRGHPQNTRRGWARDSGGGTGHPRERLRGLPRGVPGMGGRPASEGFGFLVFFLIIKY